MRTDATGNGMRYAPDLPGHRHVRISARDRGSSATIVAPHGGFIEPGTSALARSIAGRRYNLFDFQALEPATARQLHVTSTRFRHDRLDGLLARSRFAVSVHSMGSTGQTTIWLGGLNGELKQFVHSCLRASSFAVDADSPYFRGESPRNFVNLPARRGVQLELPDELLQTFYVGQRFHPHGERLQRTGDYRRFVRALRKAIDSYAALIG